MLEVKNVKSSFDEWEMNISLKIEKGKICALIGPSGSGKTTLLNLISGIILPESGSVILNKNDITALPLEKRGVAVVFQEGALFPHLTVAGNIEFGLKMRNIKDIEKKVQKSLIEVELKGFENRNISTLSGGEKQRVALARALVTNPKLLLLDEPFSNLDANLREKLKKLLRKIQRKEKITTLFVTHDLDEAFYLADSIAVLNNGKLEQQANVLELFQKPKTKFVKDFIDDYALIDAKTKLSKNSKGLIGNFFIQDNSVEKNKKAIFHIKRRNYRYMDEL